MKNIEIKHLDRIDFSVAWERMKQFTDKRSEADLDEIWFAEHDPVYTLGHAASEENILFNDDIPVVRTDRGGQVTYHGPGQLMIYFLINLKRLGWGPKRFICELENIIISLLLKYEIKAERKGGAPGIYVAGKKIASIGLKIKRGLCYHGISLNIDMDLTPFNGIVTCGIESLDVVQVTDFTDITINQIKQDLTDIIRGNSLKVA